MGLSLVYLINGVITLVAAGAVFAYWIANRKRIAAETIGRAEEQAARTMKDAERDALRHRTAAPPQGVGAQRQVVHHRAQGTGPAGAVPGHLGA
jgi:hypothetical protein